MSGRIRALTGPSLTGPAFPLRVVAGDNRTIHETLSRVPAGSVLVVDAGGYRDRAVWGEVLTIAAMQRGVVGLVLDGVTRDLEGIRALEFPVFACGTSPAGPHKAGGGTVGPVCCGGVIVSAGDVIVGDLDGVVVVPSARLTETWDAATKRLVDEQRWIERIRAGESSASVLGLHGPSATTFPESTKESQ